MFPSGLKGFPTQLVQCFGDRAFFSTVVISAESCGLPLDSLNRVDGLFSCRIPSRGCVAVAFTLSQLCRSLLTWIQILNIRQFFFFFLCCPLPTDRKM